MARIRTVKPEFWTDSLMVQLDAFTRLLYIGLWTAADDHGALRDELDRIAMEVMPREDPERVKISIDVLIASGRLSRMLNDDGSSYLVIEHWQDHQRVDKPSKSKIIREGSRKLAIPSESRRKVAIKYGCNPGEDCEASCYFCGSHGSISWPKLYSGKPGSWVAFSELELDHFQPEAKGGENTDENLVLSCRECNRSRRDKTAFAFVTSRLGTIIREGSGDFQGGKEGKGKEKDKNQRESNVHEPPVDNFDSDPPEKFCMCPDWQPQVGFSGRAESWGHSLGAEPGYTLAQLCQFRGYWQPERARKSHVQWEMAFADSLAHQRSGKRERRRNINEIGSVDTETPYGFRGNNPHTDET
ncbi:HNH endonuclease [Yokenella regensburgei]|uniref:HNH endonuclease n=1 Tax=Yokenella regensburgei TaxID=158877 RepID=UPI003ED99D5F